MSRDRSTYKETYNRALELADSIGVGAALPTEAELADDWGTSRTTVRAVLGHLHDTKVIAWSGRKKTVLRRPGEDDFFSIEETTSTSDRVESKFMEFILGGDLHPGTILREAELTREFGASTSVVREILIRFSRYGLIEKEPNRHWVLRGFTQQFAAELFDVREMFELKALKALLAEGRQSERQSALVALGPAHHRIADEIDTAYLEFPRLDEQFHRVFIDGLNNWFVDDFFGLVSIIFHYHYRWKKTDERDRNLHAIHQHLAVIDAVEAGDFVQAEAMFKEHLKQARNTLMASVAWDGQS